MTHKNSSENIRQVWIEGDDAVKYLFDGLGLKRVELNRDPVLGAGIGYTTDSGAIIIVPPKSPDERSRIKKVTFGNKIDSGKIPIRF